MVIFKKKISFTILFSVLIFSFATTLISFQSITYISIQSTKINIQADEKLRIDFEIEGPNIIEKDILNIVYVEVNSTKTNATVPEADMDVHKYNVYSDKGGNNLVISGDLEWSDKRELWESREIDLSWTGFGTFYVTVEFQTEDMSKSTETDIDDDLSYERMNVTELVIYVFIGLGTVFGIVILIVLLRAKKQGVSVERKTKESKKEVKIKEISKEEIKKAKKEKKEQVKEKGKTEVKEDLIFSVPKWEVDEDEE